jgi:hypothetical protein
MTHYLSDQLRWHDFIEKLNKPQDQPLLWMYLTTISLSFSFISIVSPSRVWALSMCFVAIALMLLMWICMLNFSKPDRILALLPFLGRRPVTAGELEDIVKAVPNDDARQKLKEVVERYEILRAKHLIELTGFARRSYERVKPDAEERKFKDLRAQISQ